MKHDEMKTEGRNWICVAKQIMSPFITVFIYKGLLNKLSTLLEIWEPIV